MSLPSQEAEGPGWAPQIPALKIRWCIPLLPAAPGSSTHKSPGSSTHQSPGGGGSLWDCIPLTMLTPTPHFGRDGWMSNTLHPPIRQIFTPAPSALIFLSQLGHKTETGTCQESPRTPECIWELAIPSPLDASRSAAPSICKNSGIFVARPEGGRLSPQHRLGLLVHAQICSAGSAKCWKNCKDTQEMRKDFMELQELLLGL